MPAIALGAERCAETRAPMMLDVHGLSVGTVVLWVVFVLSGTGLVIQAVKLHEKPGSDRWVWRTCVIVLAAVTTVASLFLQVVSLRRGAMQQAATDEALRLARSAAHGAKTFALRDGAAQRIAAAAHRMGVPTGQVLVNALADRDKTTVCMAIASALREAGWSVGGDCAATNLLAGEHEPSTPAIVWFSPHEANRAEALAAALSREGVMTASASFDPSETVAGGPPLVIVVRYL